MSRSKRSELLAGPYLEEELDPLHTPEEDVRRPSLVQIPEQLNEELGDMLEDAGRKRFDLRSGFYSGSQEATPRHVVDQDDVDRHRTDRFNVHHPMSKYARLSGSSKKSSKPSKSHGAKEKHHKRPKAPALKVPPFVPSMQELPETASGASDLSDPGTEPPRAAETGPPGKPSDVDTDAEEVLDDDDDDDESAVSQDEKGPPGDEPTTQDEPDAQPGPSSPARELHSVNFYLGAEHASKEDHAKDKEGGEQKKPAEANLGDILLTASSTDPDTDPGVHGTKSKRSQSLTNEALFYPTSTPKVSFMVGDVVEEGNENQAQSTDDQAKDSEKKADEHGQRSHHRPHHHHGHHHHHHHHHRKPDLASRRHLGSEVEVAGMLHRVPTEQDEALTLSAVDLDDMASHRLGEQRGVRRRKVGFDTRMASVVHIGKKKEKKPADKARPAVDHSPHELFVELEELHVGENAEYAWQETARWIKYEEDVEAEASRWGKPHVASLSFHSLLELRQVLAHGVILLDLDCEDLPGIVTHVVDQLVLNDQLSAENKGAVIRTLLLKHKHVSDVGFLRRNSTYFNILGSSDKGHLSRNSSTSSFRGLSNLFRSSNRTASAPKLSPNLPRKESEFNGVSATTNTTAHAKKMSLPEIEFRKRPKIQINNDHVKIEMAETQSMSSHPSEPDLPATTEPNILRRIPKGAEATTVLVGSVDFLDEPIMAFVRLRKGCFLGNLTEVPLPVRFLFVLMGPTENDLDYHEIGRSISTLMANTTFHDVAYRADERKDILDAINEFLDDSIVLPPGKWDKKTLLPIMNMAKERAQDKEKKKKPPPPPEEDKYGDPLKRTGRPFGGLVNDVRRRYPKYWSDIKDGINLQCLATFFFIYFACLSPAITFGGLLGEKTDQWMGVSELLIMTSVCGILFALFAGQPLLVVGSTGPVVIFEESLYQFCQSTGIEYMPFRVWICLWLCVIATLVVCFEVSFFVRFFTRFTMEIFASLISLIFIYEVFYKLYKIFQEHPLLEYYPPPTNRTDMAISMTDNMSLPLDNVTVAAENMTSADMTTAMVAVWGNTTTAVNPTSQTLSDSRPNTALLSLILTLGTFFIAYFLKQFRNSKFLGRSARRALGDFGIPIAIVIMVLVDFLIRETFTQKLSVPDGLTPTASDKRGWFINPLGIDRALPVYAMFAGILPALLVFILIFMETQITGMIIAKKIKKGTGFHLDMMLIGLYGILAGLLGLPLLTVATVRSVSHVSSLSVMSRTHAPGDKPTLVEVKEQRITGLCVHIMIGVSVLLGPLLRQVPLAVLFGVFLYMGIASMSGVQLFERVETLFMPRKHHPDVGYVKRVKTSRMHMYTILQLVCLAVLWVVKSTKAALAFPFFLLMMVPLRRYLLVRFFTEKELIYLDADDDGDNYDSEEDEPDFYRQAHMPV